MLKISMRLFAAFCAALVFTWPTHGYSQLGPDFDIRTVALNGDAAPDTDGATQGGFGIPVLNNEGDTAYVSSLVDLDGDPANNGAIYKEEGPDLKLVVRAGEIAPGTGGKTFITFGVSALNDWGNVAFEGTYKINVFRLGRGLWKEVPSVDSSTLEAIAVENDPAPVPGGATFGSPAGSFQPFLGDLAFNNEGNAAFVARFTQCCDIVGTGIFLEGPNLQLVVSPGDDAPGTGGASFGADFSSPSLNNYNEFAFSSNILPDTSSAGGIWKGTSIFDLEEVALIGDPAPDIDDVTMAGIGSPSLNDSFDTAFGALFTGTGVHSLNNTGIIREGSQLALVVRKGDIIRDFTLKQLGVSVLNNAGHIAFRGKSKKIPPPGGRTFDKPAIWAQSPLGVLKLVVHVDNVLEVAPGDFRTIGIPRGLPIPPDGGLSFSLGGFNDLSQVAFKARFTDGSEGLFVASPSVVGLFNDLNDIVVANGFNPGVENPLLDKLNAALNMFEKNNVNAAINILGDFISIVDAKKKISDEQADELVAAAEEIISILETA